MARWLWFFFGLLWQLSNDTDKRVTKLENRAGEIEQSIAALQDTLKKEVGDLAGPLAVQANLKEAVLNHNKVLQGIEDQLDSLEQRVTNAVAVGKFRLPRADEPQTKLAPVPSVRSDELIKAVRDKEDAVDQRYRNFQQRVLPKK